MFKEKCAIMPEELKEMVQLLSTGQWKCTAFEHKVGDGTFVRLSDNKGGIREYHCPHLKFCSDSEREFKVGDRVKIKRPTVAADRGMDTVHGTVTRKIGHNDAVVLFDGAYSSTHVKNEHLEFVPDEVDRLPEIGEYIKVVWTCNKSGYKCGDILKVTDFVGDKITAQTSSGEVHHIEIPDCVVLEGYQPPKFAVGDGVRLTKDLDTLLRLGIKNGSHGTYQGKINADIGAVRFDGKGYDVSINNSYLESAPDEISEPANQKETQSIKKFAAGDRVKITKDLYTLLGNAKKDTRGTFLEKNKNGNYGYVSLNGGDNVIPVPIEYLEPVPDEILRRAKVGEYVKIIKLHRRFEDDEFDTVNIDTGDILKVIGTAADTFIKAQTSSGDIVKLYHHEYVVLNGYSPRYNGRILFTKGDSTFVTGHIYEVVDGKIEDDGGKRFPFLKRTTLHPLMT